MPLRKLSMPIPFRTKEEFNPSVEPPQRTNLWRTSLLLASSAAFGGIAVAIWNRRTLAKMRQPRQEEYPRQASLLNTCAIFISRSVKPPLS